MARVNLEVADDRREMWGEFIEQNEDYTSLSHLVRLSVRHEIEEKRGQRPRGQPDGTPTTGTGGDTSELKRDIQRMETTIEHLTDTIRDLELDSQSSASEEEIKQMMHDAIGFIPAIPAEMSFEDYRQQHGLPDGTVSNSGGVAQKIGTNPIEAEVVLSKAARDVPHVHSERVNGERQYYQDE